MAGLIINGPPSSHKKSTLTSHSSKENPIPKKDSHPHHESHINPAQIAQHKSSNTLDNEIIDNVKAALIYNDEQKINDILRDLHYSDKAILLETLKSDHVTQLIELLSRDKLVEPELLLLINNNIKEKLIDVFTYKKVMYLLSNLSYDDIIEFISELSLPYQIHLLKSFPVKDRKIIKGGLGYPERSAGRIMDFDYIVVNEDFCVEDILEYIRSNPDHLPDRLYDIFVVNDEEELVGIIPTMNVLKSAPSTNARSILDSNFRTFSVLDDKKEVAQLFNKFNLNTAPVIDKDNKLVGVISMDTIRYIMEEESEEEILRMSGVFSELDEGVLSTTRTRFIWLFINLLTAALASWVISFFEHTIKVITALAVLMPVTISMGINAGTQTVTVIIRAMATKQLHQNNFMRYFNREMIISILNGIGFTFICFLSVYGFYRDANLAWVFGVAIFISMFTGGLTGVITPGAMKLMRTDPAVTSSIFLTTITDIVAFLSFLGLATLFLLK